MDLYRIHARHNMTARAHLRHVHGLQVQRYERGPRHATRGSALLLPALATCVAGGPRQCGAAVALVALFTLAGWGRGEGWDACNPGKSCKAGQGGGTVLGIREEAWSKVCVCMVGGMVAGKRVRGVRVTKASTAVNREGRVTSATWHS